MSVTTVDFLAPPNGMFLGLYVEKGVAPIAKAAGVRDDWIMGADWRWHRLIPDLGRGELQPALAEVSRRLGTPVEIRVEAHIPLQGGATRPPHDHTAFYCSDGTSIRSLIEPVLMTPEGFLRLAARADTLPNLAESLLSFPEQDWAWVNFYIGLGFECAAENDATALSANQVVDRLFEPLARWLV